MLSFDLLRTRTSRGRIYPLFCSPYDDDKDALETRALASCLVSTFEDAQKQHMRKGDLYDTVSALESDNDYKLVRGLCALLERRSTFSLFSDVVGSDSLGKVIPADVRRTVFAESSRVGLATSEQRRALVIKKTAQTHGILTSDVEKLIWADLDENYVLNAFDTISVADLLLWYNMSLAQTLLFGCTQMEFCIDEGSYWKTVLRAVKMQGLMYVLEYGGCEETSSDSSGRDRRASKSVEGATDGDNNNTGNTSHSTNSPGSHMHNAQIRCILDGPLSIFKMTTKYGTAFARLLPVITRTPSWHVDAVISKKTGSGTKLYRFEMSNESTCNYLRAIVDDIPSFNRPESYDSSVEQKFADILYHHLGHDDPLGWHMTREPGPIISGNKAMMPDFVFERFGRRVYLEIVGFWTPDYIRRKVSKLNLILGMDSTTATTVDNNNNRQSPTQRKTPDTQKVDMLVGIDSSLLCSQFSEITGLPGVFTFGKKISVTPILDHLKAIDATLAQEAVSNISISSDDIESDVILIRDVALRYGIPERAVPAILAKSSSTAYVVAGPHLISDAKVSSVASLLKDAYMFDDACRIMQDAGIPEDCHADLLSHAGYDVVWQDLNPANAKISNQNKQT